MDSTHPTTYPLHQIDLLLDTGTAHSFPSSPLLYVLEKNRKNSSLALLVSSQVQDIFIPNTGSQQLCQHLLKPQIRSCCVLQRCLSTSTQHVRLLHLTCTFLFSMIKRFRANDKLGADRLFCNKCYEAVVLISIFFNFNKISLYFNPENIF